MGKWPTPYSCKLMEAGIISYEDSGAGIALVKKETIDKLGPSFIGKPVVVRHQSVTPDNHDQLAVGYVTKVYFNQADAWFYVDFLITSDEVEAIEREDGSIVFKAPDGEILDGISGAYDVTNTAAGGLWHDIKFDAEILDGSFTHLALVVNPRYEETNKIREQFTTMLVNGKVAKQMKSPENDKRFFFKKGDRVAVEGRKGVLTVVGDIVATVKFDDGEEKVFNMNKIDIDNSKENSSKEWMEGDWSQLSSELRRCAEKDTSWNAKENAPSQKEISEKIALLVKEGKSQEQAAAMDQDQWTKKYPIGDYQQYKDAPIVNSKEENPMKNLFKIFRKAVNGKDEEVEKTVDIEGTEVPLSELVKTYEGEMAEKKKMAEVEAKNAEAKALRMAKDEDVVEVGEHKVTVAQLKACHAARNKKNAKPETDEEKADREKKEEKMNAIVNAIDYGDGKSEADARAKLKEFGYSDEEVEETIKTKKANYEKSQNAKTEEEKEKEAKENSKKNAKEGDVYFTQIENAGRDFVDSVSSVGPKSREEKAEIGKQRYGSKKEK